jgi:SAM-dependent methyltransferase
MSKCRFCNTSLKYVFSDLGFSPPSNAFLNKDDLLSPEKYFPLKVQVCEKCYLVQINEFAKHNEIFNDNYAYFSSFSSSWLKHSKEYTQMITKKLNLNSNSLVIEIASNDGYLLQYFKENNIPVLGIEPTANTAKVAIKKGIPTKIDFFGKKLAKEVAEDYKADLILGNNVLAHVPDINDFVSGLQYVLKSNGVVTFEFPHLLELIKHTQFDTIYHEHYSYLSLLFIHKLFEKHNLKVFDVEHLKTHGGSLRVYAKHKKCKLYPISERSLNTLELELKFGLDKINTYNNFQILTEIVKDNFLRFLINAKKNNKKVVGYGAAAKGNTFINFSGIKKDLISYVVDKSDFKQGKYLPGSHIPVKSEKFIKLDKPDFVVIFPWNLKDEIVSQLSYIKKWDGKFVVAIPEFEIL